MLLKDHMSHAGAALFRWRGYAPLMMLPLFLWAAFQGETVEHRLGEGLGDAFEMAAILLVVAGEAIRILTVGFVPAGTSGRNVTGQVAETLNTTGAYSLVRNPLYLGNCLMYVGLALFSQSILLAVLLALMLLPYYERIIAAEESFLTERFGPVYEDWAARTPAFVPRMAGFVPPALPFALRWTIRREAPSIYGAILSLYLMEYGLHHLGAEPEPMNPLWHAVAGAATLAFLAVVILRRRTGLLPNRRG